MIKKEFFERILKKLKGNLCEKCWYGHLFQCYVFRNFLEATEWTICDNTFYTFKYSRHSNFRGGILLCILGLSFGDEVIKKERGNSAHASSPNDKLSDVFVFVKIREDGFYVLFLSEPISGKLSLTFSAARKVKCEKGVVFWEM